MKSSAAVRRFGTYLSDSSRAFRDVFANPNLRRIQLAWAGSLIGTWAYGISVIVYAYENGGATAVGIVGMARWFASALASPFFGVLGDRYDRKLVMVVSDLTRAAFIGLAALTVYADGPSIIVYVLVSLIGVAATAFRPAEAALTPSLARTPEELTAANVVSSAIESIAIFGGPALGGLLLAAKGPGLVFLVSASLMLFSAFLIVRVKSPRTEEKTVPIEPETIVDELLAGLRAIARESRTRLLVGLFAAQTFVDGMLNVLIVVIALELLGTGTSGVGFLNSAVGIGGLLGALAAAALVGRQRLATDFGLGIFIWGVPIALVAIWPNEVFALVLLGIVGIGNTLSDVSGMTLMQRSAPDEVLARVFGVLESLLLFTIGLGALAAPLLVHWLGSRGALIVAGALLPVLVVPAWPRLNEIDKAARIPTDRLDLLSQNPIFAPLPESTLEQLAGRLDEVHVTTGQVVVRQGGVGDLFYLVKEGELEVAQNGKAIQSLGPGDSFGEIALLRDVPRTASVVSRSPATLFTLERGEFLAAVTGYAPSLSAAETIIGTRVGPARAGGLARA
jgi:MFS family permease